MSPELLLILETVGKKAAQIAVEFALNSVGSHLTDGPVKTEVLDLLNQVKNLLA